MPYSKRQRRQEVRAQRKDKPLTDAERFKWQTYIRNNTRYDATTGCWMWLRSISKEGYGQASLAYEHGLDGLAHRLAVVVFIGPIPEGLVARHQCHIRPCCNPAHVLSGTYQDNTDDSKRDGLVIGRQKLMPADVVEIRRLLALGMHTQGQIGDMYAVTRSTIGKIATGKNWKD